MTEPPSPAAAEDLVQDLAQPSWHSVHLFFDGNIFESAADAVLSEDVGPWLERRQEQDGLKSFFFIRYDLGGAHIRLRFVADPARVGSMEDSLHQLARTSPRITASRAVPYEPEIVRYAGCHGLGPSESLFQSSSSVTLELLAKIDPVDRAGRLGKALLAQLVLLHGFMPDARAAAEVARRFGGAYLRSRTTDPIQQQKWIQEFTDGFDRQADRLADYVRAAWTRLSQEEPLTPELDRFRSAMSSPVATLKRHAEAGRLMTDQGPAPWSVAAPYLLHSHLHMLNNRLGVNLKEECYLAVLVRRVLDDLADDSAARA